MILLTYGNWPNAELSKKIINSLKKKKHENR